MFLQERHHRILELLNENKRVIVSDLSDILNVSVDTIRRDLSHMESQKLLVRTFGGAILPDNMNACPSLQIRKELYSGEKSLLGKKAADLIQSGDTIFLEGSSTTLFIIPYLKDKEDVTVITNAIEVAAEIINTAPHLTLYVIGGVVKSHIGGAVGSDALLKLREFRVDKVFLSTIGFTEEGIFDTDFDEVLFKRQLIACGSKVYFLFDASKANRMGTIIISSYDGSFKIISEQKLPDKLKEKIEASAPGTLILS